LGRTKTVSPLRKFYKWKYSGLIVVPGLMVLILLVWFSYTGTLEFFDGYSCATIFNYISGVDMPKDVISHDELTESQHVHLHELYQGCLDYDRFSEPIKHE